MADSGHTFFPQGMGQPQQQQQYDQYVNMAPQYYQAPTPVQEQPNQSSSSMKDGQSEFSVNSQPDQYPMQVPFQSQEVYDPSQTYSWMQGQTQDQMFQDPRFQATSTYAPHQYQHHFDNQFMNGIQNQFMNGVQSQHPNQVYQVQQGQQGLGQHNQSYPMVPSQQVQQVQNQSYQQTSSQQSPSQQSPSQQSPSQQTPNQQTPNQQTPNQQAPSQQASSQQGQQISSQQVQNQSYQTQQTQQSQPPQTQNHQVQGQQVLIQRYPSQEIQSQSPPEPSTESSTPQVESTAPTSLPPPKFINGQEYRFVAGMGYYPLSRLPLLHNESEPKAPPKRKVVDPNVKAAQDIVVAYNSKKATSETPEGDVTILERIVDDAQMKEIVKHIFDLLQKQKPEDQPKAAFTAARILLSIPEPQWGKSKPDLMGLCLSNCFSTFSGDKFHKFWRTIRRFQNVIVRLRAWMVFNVNKRFIDQCTYALDFLVVMRLSHDTLTQFKFDKVLKKIIKLGASAEIEKSNKILEIAAQTIKSQPQAQPEADKTKPKAATAKTAPAKPVPVKPVSGSFFKSLSTPKPKDEKKEVKKEVKKEDIKKDDKEVEEVKASKDDQPPKEAKSAPSAFNDVMANILRVPTKRASPTSTLTAAPVETKKLKVKKRVSWRPDESLVDIRYFESEKDENRNHHASYRDLDKEEGKGLIGNNSLVEIDFDSVEDEQQQWYQPNSIFFSADVADDIDLNPPKRGGKEPVQSAEAEIMDKKNKTSLATIYGAEDEIPDSPVEPTDASQNPVDLPESLVGAETKEMVVAQRTKKMLEIMSGPYRVVSKHSFKGDTDGPNVCEAYDTVFVGESSPEAEEKPTAAPESAIPAFDLSKLPGFSSVHSSSSSSSTSHTTPPPPPPPAVEAPAANPLAALAAMPGLLNLLPGLGATPAASAPAIPALPGLPQGVDPMAFVQAFAQMQQMQNQSQQHSQPQQHHQQRHHSGYHSVAEMRKRDVRPEIAQNWDKLPPNRYSQPCRFYNSDKTCSRGNQCIFLHLPRQ